MKKELRILLLCNFLNFFGYSLFVPLYALFVLEIGGNSIHTGASVAVYAFTSGILMFIFGKLEDTVIQNRKKMIVLGYFLLSTGALAFLMIRQLWHLYAAQLASAVGFGVLDPAWKSVYSRDEDVGKEAEEWALFDGGDRIITAVAALIGGLVISAYSFRVLFGIIFAIQIFAALVSLKILR